MFMITLTNYAISDNILRLAQNNIPNIDSNGKKESLTLNKPSNRFFYDRWEIKDEFKDSVWEDILNTITEPIGEARLIQLPNGTCYMSHCDIDDRYHLNIEGQYSYLIDIDSEKMYSTIADGKWYCIDTGIRHVAANFGSVNRTQLVVRKLLNDAELKKSVNVKIFPICENPRFEFDDIISPWLHKMNKSFFLREFELIENGVSFKLDQDCVNDLDLFSKDKFKIIIQK